MKLGIILGSVRDIREGEDILQWVLKFLEAYQSIKPIVLDIKEFDLPFFGTNEPNILAKPWRAAVKACDGFIFLAPEFNHSISGALKNALDLLDWELHHKPAAFIGYGLSANGARAIEHLKTICDSYSMMTVSPNILLSILEDVREGVFQPREWHNSMMNLMVLELLELYPYSQNYLESYMQRIGNKVDPINYNEQWTGFLVPGFRGFCHTRRRK